MRNINVLSAIDRNLYGKNIRKYWKKYEEKCIQEQNKKDAVLTRLYLQYGEQAAARYATCQGNKQAADIFRKAQRINNALMIFAAHHKGRTPLQAFEVPVER